MALHTLGTAATTSLQCLAGWSEALSDADIAAISQTVTPDSRIASVLGGNGAGPTGVLATGDTHGTTTLDDLASTGGGPLASIQRGWLVLGADITPGTFVADLLSATSVQLSQVAAGSNNDEKIVFVPPNVPAINRNQKLLVPGRGILSILPGDVVAVDNTGAVILVPASAIGYAGSLWTFT